MSNLQGRVVAITGASSGIGAGIARELASASATLMLGARRTDRLEALATELREAGATVATRRLDVTDRADVAAFADAARGEFGRVDAIVNNAGVMPLSPMVSLKVDEWDRMVDVNIKGVLYGIAAVLPEMTARGSGHIVNIASVGALTVSPTAAVYCATKFAVRAISDGLRQERSDIRVTCIHPGVVESELASTITNETAAQAMKTYRAIALQPGRDRPGGAIRSEAAGRRRRQRDRCATDQSGTLMRPVALAAATLLAAAPIFAHADTTMTQATHPYVGMWITDDGHVRHELLPNGRYDEARGTRESAYRGRYEMAGTHIEYWDDTGFTADGDFVNGNTLHHGGMVLRRHS